MKRRGALCPDEAFPHTVLANDCSLKLSPRELRYYDFTGAVLGHPKLLGLDDLPLVMASGCYFARKFDLARDPYILDVIDERRASAAGSR